MDAREFQLIGALSAGRMIYQRALNGWPCEPAGQEIVGISLASQISLPVQYGTCTSTSNPGLSGASLICSILPMACMASISLAGLIGTLAQQSPYLVFLSAALRAVYKHPWQPGRLTHVIQYSDGDEFQMFRFHNTSIPGCYRVSPNAQGDRRGRFVKVFHQRIFEERGLETQFAEEFYTVSARGVIRGMHFQRPPADHAKLVYCVHGAVLDVVLDLRVGSPAYGQCAAFELNAENGEFVYIPQGLAHGFCALTDESTLVYKVSTVHSPENDCGVLWNSIGVDWPVREPILSVRDQGFAPLAAFKSPFHYTGSPECESLAGMDAVRPVP